MKTNRQQSRHILRNHTAMLFNAAEMVEEWGRYDLGNALRAMAFDFERGGECASAPKRRMPGQPSPFVANRRRARVDKGERHPMTGEAR